jgi:hypothetical protein
MGNYIPCRQTRRRHRAVAPAAPTVSAVEECRESALAAEREARRQHEANRQARAAARREQRAIDALRASTRSRLEARARLLFPWGLMAPDREIAALLTGQPRGALFPVFDLTRLLAGVNLGVSPREFGVSETAANFMTLSAPRTRSWSELTNAADFFIAAHAFEGRAFDRTELLDKARRALADLEDRLSALPDWLTVHKLRRPWFIIRPTPETAEAMWQRMIASKSDTWP